MSEDTEEHPERRISRADLFKTAGASTLGALLLGARGATEAFAREPAASGAIVRCVIHPGIGIARVGNAPGAFFIGPEVPGVTPNEAGRYKDPSGRIKRQAARFRLYGLNAAGQVVKELTADDAQITWTAHLANAKGAWYQFHYALDIPEARSAPPDLQATRRNAHIQGRHRSGLVIDPGPRSIRGKSTHGPAYHFNTGTFLGTRVPLGELRTDSNGHLLVLGGYGHSGTVNPSAAPGHIANNDEWYDDTSDGWVTAQVRIGGRAVPVTPAWVIVAPPAYAPGIAPIVTLYDIAYQAYLDTSPPAAPPAVSFTRDIYPIFQRFDALQWVNEGFLVGYGWKGQVAFLDPAMLAPLSHNTPDSAQARQAIFGRFRDPAAKKIREDAWPRIYGDAFPKTTTSAAPTSVRQYMTVTPEQYRRLGEWAAGRFMADWNPTVRSPQSLHDLPLQGRPDALDRAALDACSGGPFHPGEEAAWIVRHGSVYAGLCRLRAVLSGPSRQDYGDVLTPDVALGPGGPLQGVAPGDITRWMAVPWQTDTSNCGSDYYDSTIQRPYPFPDLPTFWPAQAPNKVLTLKAYETILQTELEETERQKAFATRKSWTRHLPSPTKDFVGRNRRFLAEWSKLGIIAESLGPGGSDFPARFFVETESGFPQDIPAELPPPFFKQP